MTANLKIMPFSCAARLLFLVTLISFSLHGIERFPPPDFESGYTLPEMTHPPSRLQLPALLDMTALAAALSLAAWLIFRRRSRRGIFWLTIGCLVYFGFIRAGCVCPIGSLQNVALALGDSGYVPPLTVIVFFVLPLLFTLFCGRVFCSGVCPLGAVQDLVLLKPVRIPGWLDNCLRPLPWFYLGLAVLYAWTDTAFIICRFDPFVQLFRLSGSMTMLIFSGLFILGCVFVGRAYCRYICPYGAVLGLFSRFSRHRVSVTPDKCIRCGLCTDACPFGAIQAADPELRQ